MTSKYRKDGMSRRHMMKMPLGSTLGAAVLGTTKGSAATDAPPKEPVKAEDKSMEYGTLGGRKISRLILGSNVPGAHSRAASSISVRIWAESRRFAMAWPASSELGVM